MFTNKSITEWYEGTKSKFKKKDFYKLIIDNPRPTLINKINARTTKMFEMGVISEVKKFLKLKIRKDMSISKAIGILEIKEFLEKKTDQKSVIEKISIKTRQYAKRQMTWARGHMVSWKKIEPKRLNNFLKKV